MKEWRFEWWETAECAKVDDDVRDCFFPDEEADSDQVIERKELVAQIICWGCPVKAECLTYALETNERFGVWGMHTQADRRELKRWMSRHPHRAGDYWDRSFQKIEDRIVSTLNRDAAQTPTLTPVKLLDRLVEDETLVIG